MTLEAFFAQNPSGALALSGGVDSSYLAWAAGKYGQSWRAYYVKAAFQPAFELRDAERVAALAGVALTVIEADVLAVPEIAANPENRCYFCKKRIFGAIAARALEDGYTVLLDGTNASDDADDRPGMRALRELSVRSPLRECGLTKPEIRRLSREAGLFTWDKPAYACLATRIPAGERLTREKLAATERAEDLLFSLGFSDFRVRLFGGAARIQAPAGQLAGILAQRAALLAALGGDYTAVLLDLEARK